MRMPIAETDFRTAYIMLGAISLVGVVLFLVRAKQSARTEASDQKLRMPNAALAFGFAVMLAYLASLLIRLTEWGWVQDISWSVVDRCFHTGLIATLFLFGYWIYVEWIRVGALLRSKPTSNLILIRKLGAGAILALGFVTSLQVLGIEVGPVLASLGIVGVALALALQETLSNYFAGITLGADRPYSMGDYIQIADGPRGTLEDVGWRSSKLRSDDNSVITIPNSRLLSSVVTTVPGGGKTVQAIVNGCVAYEANLVTIESLLIDLGREVCAEVEGADSSAAPEVRYLGFADSNMQFTVKMIAKNGAAASLLAHEYLKRMHQKFFDIGIPVNYPVRQVVNVQPPDLPVEEPPPSRDVI